MQKKVDDPVEEFKKRPDPKLSKFDTVETLQTMIKPFSLLFKNIPLELAEETCQNFTMKHRVKHFQKEICGVKITKYDLDTLDRSNWLNDTVIFCYLKMIVEKNDSGNRFQVLDPMFYTKIKTCGISMSYPGLKKADFFNCQSVFIPVCEGLHWRLIIFNVDLLELQYFDSLGFDGEEIMMTIKNFIEYKCSQENITLNSEIKLAKKDSPKQEGSDDCGVYVLLNSLMVLKGNDVHSTSYETTDAKNAIKFSKYEMIEH